MDILEESRSIFVKIAVLFSSTNPENQFFKKLFGKDISGRDRQ